MSSDQTWVEALNISPESLSNWSMQAPSGMPLLVWCMANGHVDAEKYLEWARDHYGVAVLDSRFFKDTFDAENLASLRDQSPWCAWCFPVGEWEGTTFVACAEPPSEMPEGHYAFVLADPKAMQEAWGEDAKIPENFDAPVGINPNAKSTFVLNLGDDVMGEPEQTVATVIGINDITIATSVAHTPAEPAKTPPSQSHHHNFDEKTGITLSIIHEPTSVAPPPPPPKPAAKPKSAAPAQAAAPAPAPIPAAPPANVDLRPNFERLREMYQSVLVMRCGDGTAEPFQWDKHLPIVAGDAKFKVNLSYPGFLRIVAKTLQPYHGYVIDSPSHREFFENLNVQDLPACVSALPLKNGEKLWGILVAFGGDAAKTQDALNEALTVTEKISGTLGLNKSKAA